MIKPYTIVAQASPDEILGVEGPEDLNLARLCTWPSVSDLWVALPDLGDHDAAARRLENWGFKAYVGHAYDVCRRLLSVMSEVTDQHYVVRTLVTHRHLDLNYMDELVQTIQKNPELDLVAVPRDFDITMAVDVAGLNALRQITELVGDDQETARARFNPWGYMELHPETYQVSYLDKAPRYETSHRNRILGEWHCHRENQFLGRDYSGSRYHFCLPMIPESSKVLDMACGSGFGSHLLASKSAFVMGVDNVPAYIEQARKMFGESDRLSFEEGNGISFIPRGHMESFDVVVSLHTLEHVTDDAAMLANLHCNLRPGGLLIVEVPILAKRPLGVPINPFHLREYEPNAFIRMVQDAGFQVIRVFGSCRGFYGPIGITREALQVHAIKPENPSRTK